MLTQDMARPLQQMAELDINRDSIRDTRPAFENWCLCKRDKDGDRRYCRRDKVREELPRRCREDCRSYPSSTTTYRHSSISVQLTRLSFSWKPTKRMVSESDAPRRLRMWTREMDYDRSELMRPARWACSRAPQTPSPTEMDEINFWLMTDGWIELSLVSSIKGGGNL